jgi:ABC-type phosphate transport system permease subunit
MALEGTSRDAVGIVLQILATFMAALAYVLQKKAHMQDNPISIYRNKLWIAGFVLMVLTALVDVYSFSLLDQR